MSSYTSTKTGREIDSAVNEVPKLAESISKIIEDTDKRIVSLEDNKADKKEIPKKTSDLKNDSFYEKTPNIDLCEDGTINTRDIYVRDESMLGMPKHIMITPDGVYISGDMENPRSVKINVDDIIFYDADGSVRFKLSDNGGSGSGGSDIDLSDYYQKDEKILIDDGKITVVKDASGEYSSARTLITDDKIEVEKQLIVGDNQFYSDAEIVLAKYGDDGIEYHRLSEKADKKLLTELLTDKANTNEVYAKDENILIENGKIEIVCGGDSIFINDEGITLANLDQLITAYNDIIIDDNVYKTGIGNHRLSEKANTNDVLNNMRLLKDCGEVEKFTDLPDINNKIGDTYKVKESHIVENIETLSGYRQLIAKSDESDNMGDGWWWINLFELDGQTTVVSKGGDVYDEEFNFIYSSESSLVVPTEIRDKILSCGFIYMYSDSWVGEYSVDKTTIFKVNQNDFVKWNGVQWDNLSGEFHKGFSEEEILKIFEEMLADLPNQHIVVDGLSANKDIDSKGSIYAKDDVVIMDDEKVYHSLSRKANSGDVYDLVDGVAIGELYKGDRARLSIVSDENEDNSLVLNPGKLAYNAGQSGIYFDPAQNTTTGVAGIHFNTEAEVFIRDGEGTVHKLSEKADKSYVDSKISAIYKPMGSVDYFYELPTEGNEAGYVYNVVNASGSFDTAVANYKVGSIDFGTTYAGVYIQKVIESRPQKITLVSEDLKNSVLFTTFTYIPDEEGGYTFFEFNTDEETISSMQNISWKYAQIDDEPLFLWENENIIAKAGDNFAYTADGKWDNFGGAVDLSAYYKKVEIDKKLGDVNAVLDELHNYAQALVSGGANK